MKTRRSKKLRTNNFGKTKNKTLVIGFSDRSGGAERVIKTLSENLDVDVHFLKKRSPENLVFVEAQSYGLFKVLFGPVHAIHTHLFWPGLLGAIRKWWDPSLRWIHTVHYGDYQGLRRPKLMSYLDRTFIFPRADQLVFVSEAAKKSFKIYEKSFVIPNGVDLGEPVLRSRQFNPSAPVIGCVAMLREEKGLSDLLNIFYEFRKSKPGAKLRIAGEGPLQDSLRVQTSRLGLDPWVEFCGYQKNLSDFFKTLDIYVQPSVSESFGMALVETLPFSLPIVAAKVGNIPHLLRGDFGLEIERGPHFVSHFSRALHQVCESWEPFSRASHRGYNFWKDRLKPAEMCRRYQELYEHLSKPAVCMIAPIVTQSRGGLQQQLFLQTKALARRGFRIFILQNKDPRLNLQSPEWSHAEFLQVPSLFPAFFGQRFRGLSFLILGALRLFRMRNAIHVCHAHQLYSPTLVGVFAKKILGIPLVVKVTSSGPLGELAQLQQLPFLSLRKKAFQSIDRVFALTENMRNEVLELGLPPSKVMILPNCVELPDIDKASFNQPSGSEIGLLFVGRLSVEKSIETLLFAGEALARRGHKVAIDIVGGSDKDRDVTPHLKKLAESLRENIEVTFWGERNDVASFYQSPRIFVLPSSTEGMSNSLLEALSYGMACVVSDIPANKFLVKSGYNGFLFKQSDFIDLADQLEKIIFDRKDDRQKIKFMQQNARKTIEDKFSTDTISSQIGSIYDELLKRKVRILRLFSRLNVGGPALHVVNLTFGLDNYGYQTKLVVGSLSPGEGDMSYYAAQKNVQPVFVPEFQAPLHPVKDFIAFFKILWIVATYKPDIIHTHTFKAGLLGRLAGFIFRVPCRVHTYHGHLFDGYGGPLKTKIIELAEKALGRVTHEVISVSSLVAQDLLSHKIVSRNKLQVVELGFDVDSFLKEARAPSSLRKKLNLSEEDILIGIAGRLVPIKCVDLFIKAVAPLAPKNSRVHAVIMGDGPERDKLASLAASFNAQIHFMGWMLPLHPELKDLDLLVCSSKNEGTSVSVIEAILCGTPVISTNVGGMADLLENGRWGDLVPFSEEALHQALKKMIGLLDDRDSKAFCELTSRSQEGKVHFYKRFNMSRLVFDVQEIYSRYFSQPERRRPLAQNTPKHRAPPAAELFSEENKGPESWL